MENYSRIIDAVLKKLDWDYIMKYFDNHGGFDDEEISSKRKRIKINSNTKNILTVKKELKDLIQFVIDSSFTELQHDNWIIFYTAKDSGYKIEVVFTPTRASVSDSLEDEPLETETSSDERERDVLQNMLDKSIKEENYELSAAVFSRLKKLDKSIASKK